MTEVDPIWGSEAIDPHRFNLPALKVKYLLSRLPQSGSVLEVGSGDGKILRTLAVQRPHLRVHGCDVREWRTPDAGIEFRVMTRDIPYDDAVFDSVVVVDVLEHVEDPAHLVGEIARVLRPGGCFLGFVPIEGEPGSLYRLFRKFLGDDLYVRTKHHIQSYTHSQVAGLIEPHFDFENVSHAYHALGHLMDASFFAAASLPRLSQFWWRENKYYAEGAQTTSRLAFALNRLLELGNAVAYLESRLLAKRRITAVGTLFAARRPDDRTRSLDSRRGVSIV